MPGNLTLLIDTASLIYRALFSIPDTVSTSEGKPINAAYGFLDMVARLVSDRDPAFLACADDMDWRPEWRVELLPAYKSMRAEEGSAQEAAEDRLEPQLPILFEILERLDIQLVGYPGYEAEDVIGSLVPRAPGEVAIVSGDRDLFQLVSDPDVYVLFPRRGVSELDRVDEGYIATKYGIPGRAYKDFAVLRGDPSDGLPGVRGIGPKLAADLITRYGSLDGVVKAAKGKAEGVALGKVRRELDYVERAEKVVTIPTDLPLPDVDLARPRIEPDEKLLDFATRSGLGGPVKRLATALAKT